MFVLGSSNDDKGTQLEILTASILTKMGYVNVSRNYIAPGGGEIDVRAEYIVPELAEKKTHKLICECKAHNTPISITDWYKFLGKVFLEEARFNQAISGCLIALSGANGNVTGSYDELRHHRNTVTLIAGSRLTELIAEIYEVCSLDQVSNNIQKFTGRHFIELELAYYNKSIYWIAIFDDETYTLLTAQGEPYHGSQLETLKESLNFFVSTNTYVDLQEEAEAQRRHKFAQKMVLTQIMVDDGSTSLLPLVDGNFKFAQDESDYSKHEVRNAIETLKERKWITESPDQIFFPNSPDNYEGFYSWITEIYLFLLDDTIIANVLGSSYYDAHINEQLVKKIQDIQGNLPLPGESIPEIVSLLQWSPSALARALRPDPVIVTHRTKNEQKSEDVDRNDRNYFMQQLYEALNFDYQNSMLKHYFFQVRGIRELETIQKIIVKSEKTIMAENELKRRRMIGKWTGGGYVHVLALDDAPQPWEMAEKEKDSEESEN